EMKDPGFLIIGGLLPALRKPWPQTSQPVCTRQIPKHKPFENRVTHKPHAFEAIIWKASRRWDVGCGHRNAKCGFSLRGLYGHYRDKNERSSEGAHCHGRLREKWDNGKPIALDVSASFMPKRQPLSPPQPANQAGTCS